MALITCQNCGKEISDSAKFCMYCGTSKTVENNEEKVYKDYSYLEEDERKSLLDEYESEHEEIRPYCDIKLELGSAAFVFFLIYLAFKIITSILTNGHSELLDAHEDVTNFRIMVLLLDIGASIFTLLLSLLSNFSLIFKISLQINKKSLNSIKRYQIWLNEKGIEYNAKFSQKKIQQYFDNLVL